MLENRTLRNRICFSMMLMMLMMGICFGVTDSASMPSLTQLSAEVTAMKSASTDGTVQTMAFAEQALKTFELLNTEDVSNIRLRNTTVEQVLRGLRVKNELRLHSMMYLPAQRAGSIHLIFMLITAVALCLAQGRGVMVSYIHNKDGKKD